MEIKPIQIGDYVLASRWIDADPNDPCYVGFVTAIILYKDGVKYRVDGSNREWKHAKRISKNKGIRLLTKYGILCNAMT